MSDERTSGQEREASALGTWVAQELGDGPGAARIAAQRLRLAALEHPQARLQAHARGRLTWFAVAGGGLSALALVAFMIGHSSGSRDGSSQLTAARDVGISAEPRRAFETQLPWPESDSRARSGSAGISQPSAWVVAVGGENERAVHIEQIVSASDAAVRFSAGKVRSLSLQPGGRARVVANDGAALALALERGTLRAEVPSMPEQGRAEVSVQAGPYEMRSQAASFELSWVPEQQALQLRVNAGVVQVFDSTEAGQPQAFGAGQQLSVKSPLAVEAPSTVEAPLSARRPSVQAGRTDRSSRGVSGQGSSSVRATRTGAPVTGTDVLESVRERNAQSESKRDQRSLQEEEQAWSDSLSAQSAQAESLLAKTTSVDSAWRRYAVQGQYKSAVREASRVGFDALAAEGSASDLLLLADSARLGGAAVHAKRVLMTLRERYASHPNAAVAAFTLGRMAQEFDRDDRTAIKWYGTYLSQEPGGRMAEGARARLLKAQLRVGSHAQAKAAAREYLAHHPAGSSAAVARSVLDK